MPKCLSTAAIAGIAVGGGIVLIAAIVIIIMVIVSYLRRRRARTIRVRETIEFFRNINTVNGGVFANTEHNNGDVHTNTININREILENAINRGALNNKRASLTWLERGVDVA